MASRERRLANIDESGDDRSCVLPPSTRAYSARPVLATARVVVARGAVVTAIAVALSRFHLNPSSSDLPPSLHSRLLPFRRLFLWSTLTLRIRAGTLFNWLNHC
jgi:hypothetical protein